MKTKTMLATALLTAGLGFGVMSTPVNAKSGNVTITYGWGVLRNNHTVIQRAKLPYSMEKNIPVNKTETMTFHWEDGEYDPGQPHDPGDKPDTVVKYNLKVRYLTYYRLKPNKYHKKTLVRYHYSARGKSGMKDSFQIFTNMDYLQGDKRVVTSNGHVLKQATAHYGENELYQPHVKGTTKVLRRSVDFASNKAISYKALKHATIHYEASLVNPQIFKY